MKERVNKNTAITAAATTAYLQTIDHNEGFLPIEQVYSYAAIGIGIIGFIFKVPSVTGIGIGGVSNLVLRSLNNRVGFLEN